MNKLLIYFTVIGLFTCISGCSSKEKKVLTAIDGTW